MSTSHFVDDIFCAEMQGRGVVVKESDAVSVWECFCFTSCCL